MRQYIVTLKNGEIHKVEASSYFDAKFKAITQLGISINDIQSVI